MRHRPLLVSLVVALALPLFGQTEYRDDFQAYKTPSNPPGWVDTSIGNAKPEAAGLYKAWNDPLQGNKATNVVYGTKQSSGKPEGNNPRIGTFSTLTTKKFDAKGRFEYSGRLIRTNDDSRIGLTFLSSYPETDKYYLLGLWSQNNTSKLTMQLFAFGAGTLQGTVDSNLTLDPNKWYRFLIQVDNVDNATKIRARFWPDGTTEPTTFTIDANDAAATRLATGRIGMWAAVKGDSYIDDISAKSPVDHTAPTITFVDATTQRVLDPTQLALFQTPARIEIRVTDDLSTVSYTAKLDATTDYTSATPIAADGRHKLTVNAVDAPGNTTTASLDLLVDQLPPAVALHIDGAPFATNTIFNKDVTLSALIQDLSTVTTTATLNGAAVTLPQPIAEERVHNISVTATDQVGRQTTIASSFIVDQTAPVITILANGVELGGGESFQDDVTLTWSANDLTFDRIEATLNGAPIATGTKITQERIHDLVVKAYDKAGHSTTETRKFILDKTAPEVRVLANGDTFKPGTTFNAPITFTVEANDSTPTTSTATLDNQPYTLGTAAGGEGTHTITIVVKDSGSLATTVGPAQFSIDLTPPNITIKESGEPFRDGMKFNRDISPVVTASDNLTATPLRELFLDGREFPLDTPIAEEKADHVLTAKATDDGGNSTGAGPFHFIVDKTKPVVTIVEETTGKPFGDDALFARPVRVKIAVTDLTATTIAATLNGAPFDPSGSVTADGTWTVSVVATDAVGWQNDPVTATFTIDQTPPHLTFTSHADHAVVSTPTVVLAGNADDAVTISIADAQATIDLAAKTFISEPVVLVEGTNTITAIAKDKAGNTGTVELHLELDTRAPEIAIATPATDACIDAATLTVTGTVSDPRVESVQVNGVPATLTGGAFTATIPVDEGPQLLTLVAADSLGHFTTIARSVLVDRTAPALEVRESGALFTGTLFNRAIALLVRALDADPSAQLTATLDGAPYVSGTPIDAEGAHALEVTATDCAAHRTTQSFNFTIDHTPPSLANLNPANGATVGTLPTTISGSAGDDTASIELLGIGITATPTPAFTLDGVPFAEGTNQFVLRATDRAGNSAQLDYSVTVKTGAPVITILEGGAPLPPSAIFTRAIAPEVKVDDASATLTATLNGAPYTSGTEIAADGDYRLKATATDSLSHTGAVEVFFTIDRTAPSVRITFPQSGNVAAETVEVRGVATNAETADVNGAAVALDANGAFVLPTLHLEFGTTRIVATARDRAGNIGTAEIEVTRDDVRPGILLSYPPDRAVTNRPTTEVLGRVLSPNPDGLVTIGTQTTPVDPLGAFRLSGYPLAEGDNTITASTKTNNAAANSASVVVTADFTPPALAILENGQPLNDAARFASEAVLSLQASDNRGTPTVELTIDGVKAAALPLTVTATGGHAAVAVARDQTGNETRVERTFFIGATGGGSATCALDGLDPADQSVVLTPSTTLLGRTTAAGVKVQDVAASVADGSFRATVELPQEGANHLTLRCTDGAGVAFGDAVSITLNRVTGDPSIEIASPSEGFVTADETITVSGTVGPGVTSADVNGAAAAIAGNDASVTRPFTVAGVRLAGGLNILVALGRNAAGRVATASRRVTALRDQPSLVISSPLPGAITGAAKIELAGTFADLDPATLTVTNLATGANAAVQTSRTSDTTGTFVAAEVALVAGEQTVRVTARDQANRSATASVTVRLTAGAPSIAITAPANNAYFGPGAGTFTVSGTFSAAAGATVDVGGTAATITGSNFTASAPFTSIGNNTTVVARVTEPGGASAVDTVTVARLASAPKVLESFPAPNAVEVDAGAALLVLFSAPMDRTSLASGAFRLEDPSGATVSGTILLDKDVLTFAPAALLTRGARYTLRVTTAAKDLAGTALENEWLAPFTIGTSAPSTAPALTPVSEAFCGQSLTIKGTASAGARLQLTAGTLTLTTTADAQGNFTFEYPLSGQSGYALVRVRVIGSDGSLSPAAELTFRVDCVGPQVLNATYDRTGANRLTIDFSEPVTIPAGAIYATLTDGRIVAVSNGIPAEDLTARSFTLNVTTAVRDPLGNPLAAPYTQTFTLGTEQPSAGDGSGFISGEIYDATTGRPLAGAMVTVEIPGGEDAARPPAETAALHDGPLASSPAVAQASRLRTLGTTVPYGTPDASPAQRRRDAAASAAETAALQSGTPASSPADVAASRAATWAGGGNITLATTSSPGGEDPARPAAQTAALHGGPLASSPADVAASRAATRAGGGTVTLATTSSPGGEDPARPAAQTAALHSGPLASSPADVAASRAATRAGEGNVASTTALTSATDPRGRYLLRLPEGAHTIRAAMPGYTSVWRQIIVPAGAGVVPIDIRLTKQGDTGGETKITRPVILTGSTARLTAIGAQALTGLLPLGWSPLTAAEVTGDVTNATLTFTVPAAEVTAAAQTLAAVRYDQLRDEWTVLAAVVNITNDKVTLPITTGGAYALVYADKAPGLQQPPLAQTGAVLAGVAAPAATTPLVSHAFTLDPPIVLPNGRTVAALQIEGVTPATFPSGTAVQAYIDEELRLADGSRLLDPPFATDLLLYRNLAGTLGTADFHLAPSPRAAQVILEVGFDHIRVVPYPGRLDRGTLIGNEGGRIPGDDRIAVDIPAGATPEPVKATAVSLTQQDLDTIGTIQGFKVLGGFTLTLQRATPATPPDLDHDGHPDAEVPPLELFKPAKATFTLSTQDSALRTQLVLVELLDQTPYGKFARLSNQIERLTEVRATTTTIDRSKLPLDGILHEGRYLLLAADNPIAFATGVLRLGDNLLADARITAAGLGVADLTRVDAIYAIPVPASPAAPFSLTPRHTTTGDGPAYTHPSAPAPDAIVRVDLALVPQPPTLVAVTVTAGTPPAQLPLGGIAGNVSLSTGVRATFSGAIDPASVNDASIAVLDSDTGAAVSGKATSEGTVAVNWTLTPGTTLQSDHRYTAVISPTIRGTSGAQLAAGASYSFTTAAVILNAEVHAERISITIPDANGVSRVTGAAGALPANWQAVVVRRGHDFVTRYQATAANDGSFTFLLGNGPDATDRVTMSDLTDLRVVNNAGNLAAIIPLTPFVTEDRRGFVVPAGKAAKFTTADNITVDVAEGTFETATLVTANVDTKQTFDDIPSLDADVNFAASVRLDFEGRAKKPIDVDIPVPAGLSTANRNFILALKGQSTRGPRLFAVDTLRVADDKFTTRRDASSARTIAVQHYAGNIATTQTFTGADVDTYLMQVVLKGTYAITEIRAPEGGTVGWAAIGGIEGSYELFWSSLASFYTPHTYMVERGTVVIPVRYGVAFTVVGVDATTGIQAFSKTYNPIPVGDPNVSTLPPPVDNPGGPYPVFGTPFRAEGVTLNGDVSIIPNFIVRLANGNVSVSSDPDAPLPADTKVELLNISDGTFAAGTAGKTLSLAAKRGQRIALLVEQREVDPGTALSVVFNEGIYIDGTTDDQIDAFLRTQFKLERAPLPPAGATQPPQFADITSMVRFSADSGGRRITLMLGSSLARESIYRLTLSKDIADVDAGKPGLTLGQGTKLVSNKLQPVGGGSDLHLELRVRKPGGTIGSFELQDGATRELALNGNVLLVAASGGGLIAYDVADPAKLNGVPVPIATAPANGFDFWALASDHHGRIYTTNLGISAGQIRSYRLEDFLDGGTCCTVVASTLINWRMGYSSIIGSSAFLSDRPESFPRKLQLVVQDDEESFDGRDAFMSKTGATAVQTFDNGIAQLRASFAFQPNEDYLNQRVTVENVTLDMRWSADATPASAAKIENIIAGPYDRIRVLRNRTTYGIVSHQGYGIGVYDLNAIESNRSPYKPANYLTQTEQIVLTRGVNRKECFSPGNQPAPWAIPDISVSADAAVRTDGTAPQLFVYAPEPYRGLLDLKLPLPSNRAATRQTNSPSACNRSLTGLVFRAVDPNFDHPRVKALKTAYRNASGHEPYPHFFSVASYRWRIEAQDNARGERASAPGQAATRDYVLVAGGDLGLLVVEVGGDPAPQPDCAPQYPPDYYPLQHRHLADIIWIPSGALTVRTIPRTNLAVVVSRSGRVHLVDLSRIDERFDDGHKCRSFVDLFPTAAKALASPAPYPDGVGAEDPRIVWTSEPGVSQGVLPPVVDADTGMLYAGQMVTKLMTAIAAIDPRIAMKVDLGEGGLSEVGGIVPHGIDPPKDIKKMIDALPACGGPTARCKENASLGTFRLEVTLPGAVADNLAASGNELQVALETERVFNAPSEQTPPGFPRAHLRRFRRDGSAEPTGRDAPKFRLQRVVPADAALEKALRHQRGFNKFVSPWVIAVADPRASSKYVWPSGTTAKDKEEAGCRSCERPRYLANASEDDGVYELFTNGRLLAVRPELGPAGTNIFAGTKYEYLGEQGRLVTRFATIVADTVRPPLVRLPGQNPAVAEGALQDTIFLHSGEYQVDSVDLVPGGRAGFDVVFDRTYRSRTIGATILGQGWESSNLRRLRALPSGEVELRDAQGEVWVFTPRTNSRDYDPPKGYFLRLSRTDNGWLLLDQQWRATGFDELGRLSFETDEFAKQAAIGAGTSDGNVIRYLYDASGRLAQITDPVERRSELTYWNDSDTGKPGAYPGLLKQVKDWRNRTTLYDYDSSGRLTAVRGPEAAAATGLSAGFSFLGAARPRTEYKYQSVQVPPNPPAPAQAFNDYVEFIGNLTSVIEPDQIAAGSNGKARVTVAYGASGHPRDRVTEQKWATGETVTVTNTNPTEVSTKDALGQSRLYKLTDPKLYDQRIHIAEATAEKVATIEIGAKVTAAAISLTHSDRDLVSKFTYNGEGLLETVVHPNGLTITNKWAYASTASSEGDRNASAIAPGMVLESSGSTGTGLPTASLTTDIQYDQQNGETTKATPVAVKRGNDQRDAQSPSSERREVVTKGEDYSVATTYDANGLPVAMRTLDDKNNGAVKQVTTTTYFDEDSPSLIERQCPKAITTSNDATQQTFKYALLPNGGETITAKDEIRGTISESQYDSWGRLTHQKITEPGGTVLTDETSGYDAAGRLTYHSRKQTGAGDVVTRYEYDPMSRQTKMTMTGAAVSGSSQTLTQVTEHDVTARKVTEHDPVIAGGTGATTVKELDTLGRPLTTTRIATTGERLEQITGFDAAGAPSYTSDRARTATAIRNDALGRVIASASAQGIYSETTWSDWNTPLETVTYDAAGKEVARTKNHYTPQGRLQSTADAVSDTEARITRMTWEQGDTILGTRVGRASTVDALDPVGPVRVAIETFDASGRKTKVVTGGATGMANPPSSAIFSITEMTYLGDYPDTITTQEPLANAQSRTFLAHDGLGRVVQSSVDGAQDPATMVYDEAGNALSATAPGMKASIASYDSRGLVTQATHPGGGTVKYTYDALGNLITYEDEVGEKTSMITDGFGRVTRTNYPDGTSEETVYEGKSGLVAATRDRANQWLAYQYGPEGRVLAVHSGQNISGPKLVQYEYDKAGRLEEVRNANAGISYEGYDFLGRATTTRTRRYKNGSGLNPDPAKREVLDVHTQSHAWTIHDERSSWGMPAAGTNVPADIPGSKWLQIINETRDAGANLTSQERGPGDWFTSAIGRAPRKLAARNRSLAQLTLDTVYGYADGSPSAVGLPPTRGANNLGLRYAQTRVFSGATVAGSANGRDAAERIAQTRDLGIGNRVSSFTYDVRGRLETSGLGMSGPAAIRPPTVDQYTAADFRSQRSIPPVLSPSQHQTLSAKGDDTAEAASWQATEDTHPHQILSRQSYLAGTPASNPRAYQFQGGRRTKDGDWSAAFDEFGRLTAIESSVAGRRIEYTWGPDDRIVGRTAYKRSGSSWDLENREPVLREDGLPAKTTFVWDPIADNLVAIFEEGASVAQGANPASGLLRQYLHGGQGVDDPVRVLVYDEEQVTVHNWLPILDEAGTGSLQAVVDASTGNVVERVLYADAYGDAPRFLHGPVVDQVTVQAKKDQDGELEKVTIRVRLSEPIDIAALANLGGVRLEVVNNGTTVYTSTTPPSLADPYTVQWELGALQWMTLKSFGPALEIAVTQFLRSPAWGTAPVMPAPDWAQQLYGVVANKAKPFALRQSFSQFDTVFAAIQPNGTATTELYAMPDLYLAADRESTTKLLTGFKAAPFIEPATKLAYFRARWYDAATGSWLTPDPRGYAAGSSNLYTGFANDPVNHIDPDGNVALLDNIAGCGISVGIGLGASYLFGNEYTWTDAGIDCAVGFVTSGLSSIAKVRHFSKAAIFAADVALDLGGEAARRSLKGESFTWGELATRAAVNQGIGRALSWATGKITGRLFNGGCRCLSPDTEVATPDGPREIAQLRVGDRVSPADPQDSRDTDVDPATWRLVRLRMPMLDESGDVMLVEMLRPLQWIQQVRAATGSWIDLKIPELALEGTAEVLSIGDVPAIQPGPGRVVIATFEHDDVLLEIKLAGQTGTLRPTPWHLLYSADRDAFVRSGELRPGERLRTRDGDLRIESVTTSPERSRVRDIEVEYEHVYFAGEAAVLSHNSWPCPPKLPEFRRLLDSDEAQMRKGWWNTVKEHGPVVARAYDTDTGWITRAWTNNDVVPELHPILQSRVDELLKWQKGKRNLLYPLQYIFNHIAHDNLPGTHAEVYAVNEILLRRRDAGMEVSYEIMKDMFTDQRWLMPFMPYGGAKMCPHCTRILWEVPSLADKQFMGKGKK